MENSESLDFLPAKLPENIKSKGVNYDPSFKEMVEQGKNENEFVDDNKTPKSGVWFEENDSLKIYRSYLYNTVHGKIFYYHKLKKYVLCEGKYSRGRIIGDWKYYNQDRQLIHELKNIRRNKVSVSKYAPTWMAKCISYKYYDSRKKISREVKLLFNKDYWPADRTVLKHGDEKIFNEKGQVTLLNHYNEGELKESLVLE